MTGQVGRKSGHYSQAERLAKMVRTLSSRAVTVNELAGEFGITRRQVYRDLDHIAKEGHPLNQEGERRDRLWSLPLNYKGLPPITLSPNELMALYLAKSHLAHLTGTPFTDDLDRVTDKLKSGLPRKTIEHLERILQVFIPRPRMVRSYAAQKSVLTLLRQALLRQRTIQLHYQKAGQEGVETQQVDPYSLLLYESGLYLIGYSHRAEDLRKYAIERIKQVEITDSLFAVRSDLLNKAQSQRSFGIIEGPAMHVRVRFSRDVAHLLKEREWHPTQKIIQLSNGDVLYTMHAGGLKELTIWVLSWGARAEVLAPPELIQEVKKHVSALARTYGA